MIETKPRPTRAIEVYQQMYTMVTSHWVAQVVRAAVDLSLADHLAENGPWRSMTHFCPLLVCAVQLSIPPVRLRV